MTAERAANVLLIDSVGYENLGGASTVINEIINEVDRARFVPTLAALGPGLWPDIVRASGTTAYSFARGRLRSPSNLLKVVLGLARVVRRDNIDIIHASENSALLYGALAGRLTRKPVVWHIHAPLWPHWRAERMAGSVLQHLPPAHIIFTSPGTQRKSISFPGVASSVVFPGVDLEKCRSGDAERGRAAFEIPDDAQVISMFARVVPEKGQTEFVHCLGRLFANHPDLYGVMCGHGGRQGPYWRKLQEIGADYGVTDHLFMPGDVRSPLKDDIMAATDVVVHPARSEPFGLAVLEAMAAGKPVVATKTDGPGLLIDDGVDGILVDPGDADALTDAVGRLLDNPEQRSALGARALHSASRYPAQGMTRRCEDIWDDVLGRRPA